MPRLIAIDMEGGPAFVDATQRVWDTGDVVLPLDSRVRDTHRTDLARRLGATHVMRADGTLSTIGPDGPTVRAHIEDGDAVVMATSGTTGDPKGVVLTHRALEHNARTTATSLGSTGDSWWLACLPLSHIGGFSVVSRALLSGSRLSVIPHFDAAAVTALAHGGCTHVSLVPTALRRIDATVFERILVGAAPPGGPLPSNCVTSYGASETCGGFVHDGKVLEGARVRLDAEGRIMAATPALLRCYVDGGDPTETDEDDVRWFATGDVGRIDHTGRLEVIGRHDDMIITGGENVWPEPVEAALRALAGIDDVAVVGRVDDEWGQRVTAVVVPAADARPTLEACVDAVRASLPPYASPKELVFVDSLPRTPLGKLRHGRLREALGDAR